MKADLNMARKKLANWPSTIMDQYVVMYSSIVMSDLFYQPHAQLLILSLASHNRTITYSSSRSFVNALTNKGVIGAISEPILPAMEHMLMRVCLMFVGNTSDT